MGAYFTKAAMNNLTLEGYDPNEHELLKDCLEWAKVGSRVTCPTFIAPKDYDVLCWVPERPPFVEKSEQEGFEIGGSKPTNHLSGDNKTSPFTSLTKVDVNLIVTDDPQLYRLFLVATRLSARFNLTEKSDRIALFQAVLYGNG